MKEYLEQGMGLDLRIRSALPELEQLRETEAELRAAERPPARALHRARALEERLEAEISRMVELKEQIGLVIDQVPKAGDRAVLRCRYVLGLGWEEIGDELHCSRSSLHRRHSAVLERIVLPEDAIFL